MSQVIVEVSSPAQTGGSTLVAAGSQYVSETTSSGTAQSAKPSGASGSIVTVNNNGSDAIWVAFGKTAAVLTGHFIAPNGIREFGNYRGATISVINDS